MWRCVFLAMAAQCSWSAACLGQVVQLPTFHTFSVQTTVSVPVSGAGFAAGVGHANLPWRRDGHALLPWRVPPAANVAGAARLQAGHVSVGATVIDHQEIDASLRLVGARSASHAANNYYSAHVGRTGGDSDATFSVAELEEQREAAQRVQQAETAQWWQRAEAAEAAGRAGVARVYYQMVVRRDSGTLGQQARSRLAALKTPDRAAP